MTMPKKFKDPVQVNLRLERVEREHLARLSKLTGTSVNDMIRDTILVCLIDDEQETEQESK